MSTKTINTVQGKSLETRTIWLFAIIAFPLQAITMAVSVYLPQHFAKNLGLDLATLGFAFSVIRIIDLPFDPLLGIAIDRTRIRANKYRVWLIAGAPVTMVAIYALFMAKPGMGMYHIMFWLLVMYLGTSMITLSHSAWAALISPSYNERSRIFAAIGVMGVVGMTLLFATPLVASQLGREGLGVPEMGWFILASIPVAISIGTLWTPSPGADYSERPQISWKNYVSLLSHPNMARIALAMLLFTVGTAWEGALFLFYFTDGRGFTVSEVSSLLIAALGAGLLGAPLIARLSMRLSKHQTVVITALCYAAALSSLMIVPKDAKLLACIPVIVTGFLYAGFHVLLRSMTADVSDEIRLAQGADRSALLYALLTLAPKLAAAIAIGLTFNVMAQIGYQPSLGANNGAEALQGLGLAYLMGPICFVLLGALCVVGYNLGPQKTAEIRALLATLK